MGGVPTPRGISGPDRTDGANASANETAFVGTVRLRSVSDDEVSSPSGSGTDETARQRADGEPRASADDGDAGTQSGDDEPAAGPGDGGSRARLGAGYREGIEDRQFYALYFARFAAGFGISALVTLLPFYINVLDPSGLMIGLFTTGLTVAQTGATVPLAWWADRGSKRTVLLAGLGASALAYGGFALVGSPVAFVGVRMVQGVAITATGLTSLALVGELAPVDERANRIGTANAFRFAASILGAGTATALYQLYGFDVVFALLVAMLTAGVFVVYGVVDPDPTRIEGFPFSDLAINRRILTMTSFRAQYAVAVTLVRTWVPIYAGVAAAKGGLAYAPVAVGVVYGAERFTNMIAQPYTGRLSDRYGRAGFVFLGGGLYGVVALLVPFSPAIGGLLPVPESLPLLGDLGSAFVPLVLLNGCLGIADSFREPASMALFADEGSDGDGVASSFGIRELVWRPGSIAAPLLGGFLMTEVGMSWVFFVGAAAAFSGIAAFLAILSYDHGRGALTTW
jgi:MFS family permease